MTASMIDVHLALCTDCCGLAKLRAGTSTFAAFVISCWQFQLQELTAAEEAVKKATVKEAHLATNKFTESTS